MVGVVQAILFFSLINKFVIADKADFTFRHYCNHPPNFGRGKLDASGLLCTVTFHTKISDDSSAAKFCDMQNPFTLDSYELKSGYIVCKITFMSNNYIMWVANDGGKGKSQMMGARTVKFKGEAMHGNEGNFVPRSSPTALAIITSRGVRRAIPRGRLTYVTKETPLVLLCSRNADVLQSYNGAMIDRLSEVGISVRVYKDSYDNLRPFYIPRELIAFETTAEGQVSARRHHEVCKIFLNGYAATPFDFENVEDFKDMLIKEKVNIVAAPGQADDLKLENLQNCQRDHEYKTKRTNYRVTLMDGKRMICSDKIWRERHPDRTCADTPRIALGFSQEGLVDIPATARLFTACTFGRKFVSNSTGMEHRCHNMARYNSSTGKCGCDPPSSDILVTKMFYVTKEEKQIYPGIVCVDCDVDLSQNPVIMFDRATRLYCETLRSVVGSLLFASAHTNSRIHLLRVDKNEYEYRAFKMEATKNGYSAWSDLANTIFSLCAGNINDQVHTEYALKKAYEILSDEPEHKRTLVFITAGNHANEKEVMLYINKMKEINVKIIPIGFIDVTDDQLANYVTKDQKAFNMKKGKESALIHSAATHFDQTLARNVCLRK